MRHAHFPLELGPTLGSHPARRFFGCVRIERRNPQAVSGPSRRFETSWYDTAPGPCGCAVRWWIDVDGCGRSAGPSRNALSKWRFRSPWLRLQRLHAIRLRERWHRPATGNPGAVPGRKEGQAGPAGARRPCLLLDSLTGSVACGNSARWGHVRARAEFTRRRSRGIAQRGLLVEAACRHPAARAERDRQKHALGC